MGLISLISPFVKRNFLWNLSGTLLDNMHGSAPPIFLIHQHWPGFLQRGWGMFGGFDFPWFKNFVLDQPRPRNCLWCYLWVQLLGWWLLSYMTQRSLGTTRCSGGLEYSGEQAFVCTRQARNIPSKPETGDMVFCWGPCETAAYLRHWVDTSAKVSCHLETPLRGQKEQLFEVKISIIISEL